MNKTVNGLHEAAYLLAIFALLSQLLALVRDRLLAHHFGASVTLDIYYAAFRIPDFLFISIASLVSLFVLIPFLTDKIAQNKEEAKRFLSNITTAFFVGIVLVSIIVFFFVPVLVKVLFPGFTDPAVQSELVLLTRILLLSPIILGFSNILASVTQVFKKFFIYALSPVVYNVGIIIGIVFLYPVWGVYGVVYGVVLGSLLHVVIQIPTIVRQGVMPNLISKIDFKEVRRVVKVSFPRTIALAGNQIALFVLIAFASLMPEGSISVFNFGFNLQSAPLAVIGVSYSVAAFPTLSKLFSKGNLDGFMAHMITAMRHILFWSFPAIVLVIVLRAQIVRTVLGSGAFDWADTRLTAAVLALFVLSLASHSLMLLFLRGYYAKGETKRPLIVNTISSLLIIVFAYIGINLFSNNPEVLNFVADLFRVGDISGAIVLALPLAYALGMIINSLIYWFLFKHDFKGHLPKILHTTIWQSIGASLIMGIVAYGGLQVFEHVFDLNTLVGIFLQGFISGILGILAGGAVLWFMGNKEVREVWRTLHHKFWKQRPVGQETEEI